MTASIYEQVEQQLLAPADLQSRDIENALSMALSGGVDYADLYFQQSHAENWVLERGVDG